MEFGERQYSAQDPAGHHWTFSQTLADVAPEEWGGSLLSRSLGCATATTRWSLEGGTTGSPRRPTWRAQDARAWCSSGARASAARRSPSTCSPAWTRGSPATPTSSACSRLRSCEELRLPLRLMRAPRLLLHARSARRGSPRPARRRWRPARDGALVQRRDGRRARPRGLAVLLRDDAPDRRCGLPDLDRAAALARADARTPRRARLAGGLRGAHRATRSRSTSATT